MMILEFYKVTKSNPKVRLNFRREDFTIWKSKAVLCKLVFKSSTHSASITPPHTHTHRQAIELIIFYISRINYRKQIPPDSCIAKYLPHLNGYESTVSFLPGVAS